MFSFYRLVEELDKVNYEKALKKYETDRKKAAGKEKINEQHT